MAKVVGFISEKGGTGKTTACYHIAVALQKYHEKRVLVVDADYQRGGITGRFFPDWIEKLGDDETPGITLFHKFQQLYGAVERSPKIDIREWQNGIDVICSDKNLAQVTHSKLPGTNNIHENNVSLMHHLQVIDYVLEPLKQHYDYILIDTHPETSDLLRSVIFSCDYCVSPVKLDRQSAVGVPTVTGAIKDVNRDVKQVNDHLEQKSKIKYTNTKFSGSIGMMTREYAGNLKWTESVEFTKLYKTGKYVFKAYITEGDGLRQAALERKPVYDLPGQNAAKQSQQFRKLTNEFCEVCP